MNHPVPAQLQKVLQLKADLQAEMVRCLNELIPATLTSRGDEPIRSQKFNRCRTPAGAGKT